MGTPDPALLWTGHLDLDDERHPIYRVDDVARIFFGKRGQWLRWQERLGNLSDPKTGEQFFWVEELGRGEHSRLFSLQDVERLVARLLENGAISHRRAECALLAIKSQIDVYDLEIPQFFYEGKSYVYSVDDVAVSLRRSKSWVRAHAADYEGVRRAWVEGSQQESWRFAALPTEITPVPAT